MNTSVGPVKLPFSVGDWGSVLGFVVAVAIAVLIVRKVPGIPSSLKP